MPVQLLRLRYLQLKRDLSYWFVIIFFLAFGVSKAVAEVSYTYALVLLFFFLILILHHHLNRKDLNFVEKYFLQPKREFLITYNLLTLPVSIALLVAGYAELSAFAHLGVSLIPLVKKQKSELKLAFISRYIPPAQFEWIAGVRKNFFVLLPLLILAVFFSPVKFFGVVALFLINTVVLGFYTTYEPLVMLNPENRSAQDFLKQKLKFLQKVLLCFHAPLLLVNSLFHPDIFWFNACFLLSTLLLASYTIHSKYANYAPKQEAGFKIDGLFVYASTLIPFLIPLSLFINAGYKKRALHNLLNYADD